MASSEIAGKPPYVGFKSFVSTLRGFKETGVPAQVDNSVLTGKSGSIQSAIKATLEFLGAVAADGTKTPRLDALVNSVDSLEWQNVLRETVEAAYKPVFDGLDVSNGTSRQLEQKFAEFGITGSTKGKAIRFFLQALDEAGIKRSQRFKAPAQAPRSRKTSTPNGEESPAEVEPDQQMGKPPHNPAHSDVPPTHPGMESVSVNLPGRTEPCVLYFHSEIRQREWDHLVSQLQGYWELKSEMDADE